MNITIYMSVPITSTLKADALFSELRWERNVLDALLENKECENIYIFTKMWKSPQPIPFKLHNECPQEVRKNTIGIMLGVPLNPSDIYELKSFIFNCYWGGFDTPIYNIFSKLNQENKKFVVTDGFIGNSLRLQDLKNAVGDNNVELLPIPAIPKVSYQDNFNKNIILWSLKDIFSVMNTAKDIYIDKIFQWINYQMEINNALEFHIITGLCDTDLDFRRLSKDIEHQFHSHPSSKIFSKVKNRIKIYKSLDWNIVLDLYSNTKIIVSQCITGLECAMYGIPFVGLVGGIVKSTEKYLGALYASDKWFELQNKLFTDHTFYREIGDNYRDFAVKHHTYEAFNNNINKLIKEKGL